MPLGRARQFDDDYHKKLRAKVAKHRRRKAAEIAERAALRSLAAGRKRHGRTVVHALGARQRIGPEL